MRIGAVHRGGGPRDVVESDWGSFDHHLQSLALGRGARLVRTRIDEVSREDAHPVLHGRDGTAERYDLVVVAAGVNSGLLKAYEGLGIGYERPKVTKTLIREYHLGAEAINAHLGTSMHVFLLNIPRLEFAALIPKGDYVTMCLLGEDIDNALGDAFAEAPEVRAVMPEGWQPDEKSCQCLPHINIHGVAKPFADRIVFIGDTIYTLVELYAISKLDLYHFDFYRFEQPQEWRDAGFRDLFDGRGVCLVEWPERAAGLLPAPDLSIALAYAGASREATLSSACERGQHCLEKIERNTR